MTDTTRRSTHARAYLMCPPEYFAVQYKINPWMNPDRPVDADLAMRQWQRLSEVYQGLGHTVHTITPEPGLPDMVFAANGVIARTSRPAAAAKAEIREMRRMRSGE